MSWFLGLSIFEEDVYFMKMVYIAGIALGMLQFTNYRLLNPGTIAGALLSPFWAQLNSWVNIIFVVVAAFLAFSEGGFLTLLIYVLTLLGGNFIGGVILSFGNFGYHLGRVLGMFAGAFSALIVVLVIMQK